VHNLQIIAGIFIFAVGVWLTRFLPFAVFKKTDRLPKYVSYLGSVLPAAIMGLLVIYCIKDYHFSDWTMLPVLAAAAVVVGVHMYKRNTILSITAGTVVYMVLLRIF